MPDQQNSREKDFSIYDAMETAQLEEILRLDAKSTEGNGSDTDALFYIMEVLADRKRKEGAAIKSPEEAFRSFQQNYLPCDCMEDEEQTKVNKKPWGNVSRFSRSILAAAAALALIVGGVITAKGFGVDVWEVFLQWTQETFHFADGSGNPDGNQPGNSSNLECEELIQALKAYDVTANVIPTWLPDGYVFTDISVTETPKQLILLALFSKNDEIMMISLKSYINSNPEQIEQSDALIETYTTQGVTYYIFLNNDTLQAAWVFENYECYISGSLSADEMKRIIDSIKKG